MTPTNLIPLFTVVNKWNVNILLANFSGIFTVLFQWQTQYSHVHIKKVMVVIITHNIRDVRNCLVRFGQKNPLTHSGTGFFLQRQKIK